MIEFRTNRDRDNAIAAQQRAFWARKKDDQARIERLGLDRSI